MKDRSDAVIIGGGIIGASIAYNLAMTGFNNLVVLDMETLGSGSTAAALGGFRYQFSNPLNITLSKESIAIMEHLLETTGYDPLIRYDGYVFLASKEESFAGLKNIRNLTSRYGIPVDLVTSEELQELFPFYLFDGTIGGNLCMKEGHASTLAVLQGFVTKAKERGVEFCEHTKAIGIKKHGESVTGVVTERGDIATEKIVIASGAYSGLVGELAGVHIPVSPYPRRVLVTRNFNDGIPDKIPLLIDVDSKLRIGREGKGIIMAANEETLPSFELRFDPDYDQRVMNAALHRVPSLARASVAFGHMGLYEVTPDSLPILSEVHEARGLYCCAGFAGHGFMHGPAAGVLMSEIISGKKPHLDVSSLDIDRFGKVKHIHSERLI